MTQSAQPLSPSSIASKSISAVNSCILETKSPALLAEILVGASMKLGDSDNNVSPKD